MEQQFITKLFLVVLTKVISRSTWKKMVADFHRVTKYVVTSSLFFTVFNSLFSNRKWQWKGAGVMSNTLKLKYVKWISKNIRSPRRSITNRKCTTFPTTLSYSSLTFTLVLLLHSLFPRRITFRNKDFFCTQEESLLLQPQIVTRV